MRSIAARLGISGNTVAKAVEPVIRALLRENPRMPATVLAERVGWSGSPAWFRENVARIRPEYAPADPADRISYEPGDQAQCDLWFPEVRIPVGGGKPRVLPVLVMVSSHSRFIMARMLLSRMTGDLLAGMWELIGSLGAVPRRLIWDNEAGIGRRNSYAAGVGAFAGVLSRRYALGWERYPLVTNAAWPKTIGLCDTSHPSISPDRARARRWTLRGRVRDEP